MRTSERRLESGRLRSLLTYPFRLGPARPALVLVAVVAFAASITKTAFDAVVQDEIPRSQRATFLALYS